jgi:hypothetical protein
MNLNNHESSVETNTEIPLEVLSEPIQVLVLGTDSQNLANHHKLQTRSGAELKLEMECQSLDSTDFDYRSIHAKQIIIMTDYVTSSEYLQVKRNLAPTSLLAKVGWGKQSESEKNINIFNQIDYASSE